MNLLYTAFDVFPLPKGASTHIAHSVATLRKRFETLHLVVLGGGDMPAYQEEGNVLIHRWMKSHPNFLRRTEDFGAFLSDLLSEMPRIPEIIHFRDIWSGIPILAHPRTRKSRMIFEVNGLPSVELPYRYPETLRNSVLMAKIRSMENHCLDSAHGIITVSEVNKRCLISRGTSPEKISVIPNTVESVTPNAETGKPPAANMILYVGTFSPWQGLPVLLKACAMLPNPGQRKLMIVGSTKKHFRPVRKLVRKLDIASFTELKIGLPHRKVQRLFREAALSVAPLTRCSRNEIQGCSPFKLIESMNAGTPVIASRLPVCSEIIEHGRDGWLVGPDSPRALALAMEKLLNDPDRLAYLGKNAKIRISECFVFDLWERRVFKFYDNVQQKGGLENGASTDENHSWRDHESQENFRTEAAGRMA
ncbi:MAG: hypothetical protein B6245_14220 [Desulfobacteraceae bacterium 4572_88]|nr:MAG: hypothetical protein B6245_14220 [Desulfobacteraceae bacterium 4572_88]